MKKLLLFIFAVLSFSAFGVNNTHKFTIEGKIDGLMPGDTLRFYTMEFITYDRTFAFDVVVKRDGEFRYTSPKAHSSQYYKMVYHPKSGKLPQTLRNALSLLISNGNYRIYGKAKNIYMSTISGGAYDDPHYRKMAHLKDSLDILHSELLGKIENKNNTKEDNKRYSEQFNTFHETHKEAYDLLSSFKKQFMEESVDCDLLTIEYLNHILSETYDTLRFGYDRLTDRAKKERYGVELDDKLSRLEKLTPGYPAPDFVLKNDSIKVTLQNCSGKYVLLYHWGTCPASMFIDAQVLDFHKKYGDKVKVIGVTNHRQEVINILGHTEDGTTVMGMDLKKILNGFLSHPYPDFELKKQVEDISKTYFFAGLPYFTLISPERKIIMRGFGNILDEAIKEIEKISVNAE